jgi:hypothetical protein
MPPPVAAPAGAALLVGAAADLRNGPDGLELV